MLRENNMYSVEFASQTDVIEAVSHSRIAGATFVAGPAMCDVKWVMCISPWPPHLSDFKLRRSRRMALVMMVWARASTVSTLSALIILPHPRSFHRPAYAFQSATFYLQLPLFTFSLCRWTLVSVLFFFVWESGRQHMTQLCWIDISQRFFINQVYFFRCYSAAAATCFWCNAADT